MRYFFPQELRLLLDSSGFSLLRLSAFPDLDVEPDDDLEFRSPSRALFDLGSRTAFLQPADRRRSALSSGRGDRDSFKPKN